MGRQRSRCRCNAGIETGEILLDHNRSTVEVCGFLSRCHESHPSFRSALCGTQGAIVTPVTGGITTISASC